MFTTDQPCAAAPPAPAKGSIEDTKQIEVARLKAEYFNGDKDAYNQYVLVNFIAPKPRKLFTMADVRARLKAERATSLLASVPALGDSLMDPPDVGAGRKPYTDTNPLFVKETTK